jgi:hypothetical protein
VISDALPALGPRGKIVVVGIHERSMEFNATMRVIHAFN